MYPSPPNAEENRVPLIIRKFPRDEGLIIRLTPLRSVPVPLHSSGHPSSVSLRPCSRPGYIANPIRYQVCSAAVDNLMRTSQIVHLQVSARGTTYFFSGTCRKLYTHIAFEVTRFHNMKSSCSVLADNVPNEINVLTFSPLTRRMLRRFTCCVHNIFP